MRRLLVALLFLLLPALPVRADEPDYGPDGIPEGSVARSLPGNADVAGHRAWLNARGIRYQLWYRTDVLSNLSGGLRRGTVNQGLLESIVNVDLERLAGAPGLRFFSNQFVIHNTGRIRRDYVGGLNTIAAIEAVPALRLSEFWLEQSLAGGAVRLRAGQLAADISFFFAETSFLFLQSDWPTISAANLPSGGPAYPLATPGIQAEWDPAPGWTLRAGFFNGDPAGPGPGDEQARNRNGLDWRLRDRALLLGEAQWRTGQEAGLARTLKIGGWAHLGRFDSERRAAEFGPLADPAGSGVPLRRRGNGGGYAVIEQQLFRPAGGDAESGVTAFLRASAAPRDDRSLIGLYLDGGVVARGLLAARPNDAFGIAFIYAQFSDAARGFDRDRIRLAGERGPVRDFEANLELTWKVQILPGLHIQPVVTRVWHPNGDRKRDALVAGFRTHLRF